MAKHKHIIFWSVALGVLALDRITKIAVLAFLPLGVSRDVWLFALTHVRNTGTVFGLAKEAGVILGLFAIIVCVYIIYNHKKYRKGEQVVAALVFAGALGNLVDRMWYGAVIDFVDIGIWPVFNVADVAITVAIVLLLIDAFRQKGERKL